MKFQYADLSRLLAPSDCLLCEAVDTGPVCKSCLDELEVLPGRGCRRCGNPEVSNSALSCAFCRGLVRRPALFCHLHSYRGRGRDLLQAIKFQGYWPLIAKLLERQLATVLAALPLTQFEAVVPIPQAPARRIARLYNPAEEIARALSRLTGLPLVPALRMRLFQPRQLGQDAATRRANARHRFSLRRPAPRALILVDDVLTTGSTLAEAQRCLQQGGAEYVAWFTLFRKS